MANVFLGLGSNLGDKIQTLQNAIAEINTSIGIVKSISNFYETEPWGFFDENFFVNCAVLISTKLKPDEILLKIHQIENKFKRIKTKKNIYEARTIDIDIIFYENNIYSTQTLHIPHKLAHLRKFVLLPLNDLAPNFIHPLLDISISNLLKNCQDNTKINNLEFIL